MGYELKSRIENDLICVRVVLVYVCYIFKM
jgi:hypothetical protein